MRKIITVLIALCILLVSCTAADEGTEASNSSAESSTSINSPTTIEAENEINDETSVSSTIVETTDQAVITNPVTIESTTNTASDSSASKQVIEIKFVSRVSDVSSAQLQSTALAILNDPRGWQKAGFEFVATDEAASSVILAEGLAVDKLCLPLETYAKVSCQNGHTVALNANRWRSAVPHWDGSVQTYREYLINHEVGHLIGQRHPKPRCPVTGRPAGVMEQQTANLQGCTGNGWPRDWEIALASKRPIKLAPLPDWAPDPVPTNAED